MAKVFRHFRTVGEKGKVESQKSLNGIQPPVSNAVQAPRKGLKFSKNFQYRKSYVANLFVVTALLKGCFYWLQFGVILQAMTQAIGL